MNESDSVTIAKTEHNRLVRSDAILEALRAYGVDNWEGYSEAVRSVNREDAD